MNVIVYDNTKLIYKNGSITYTFKAVVHYRPHLQKMYPYILLQKLTSLYPTYLNAGKIFGIENWNEKLNHDLVLVIFVQLSFFVFTFSVRCIKISSQHWFCTEG